MIDYMQMKVGDETEMPERNKWEGVNQSLYRQIQDATQGTIMQFEVTTHRAQPPGMQPEMWFTLKRIR